MMSLDDEIRSLAEVDAARKADTRELRELLEMMVKLFVSSAGRRLHGYRVVTYPEGFSVEGLDALAETGMEFVAPLSDRVEVRVGIRVPVRFPVTLPSELLARDGFNPWRGDDV